MHQRNWRGMVHLFSGFCEAHAFACETHLRPRCRRIRRRRRLTPGACMIYNGRLIATAHRDAFYLRLVSLNQKKTFRATRHIYDRRWPMVLLQIAQQINLPFVRFYEFKVIPNIHFWCTAFADGIDPHSKADAFTMRQFERKWFGAVGRKCDWRLVIASAVIGRFVCAFIYIYQLVSYEANSPARSPVAWHQMANFHSHDARTSTAEMLLVCI